MTHRSEKSVWLWSLAEAEYFRHCGYIPFQAEFLASIRVKTEDICIWQQ